MISSLLPDLQRARSAYGPTMNEQECVALLNRVAWDHKADGWGLSRKPNGHHGTMSDGTPVAIDVLYHQPSRTVWDVLGSSGAESRPTWNSIKTYDFNGRPWVAPIAPGSSAPGPIRNPPPPPPVPPTNPPPPVLDYSRVIADLRASVAMLTQRVGLLERREPTPTLDVILNSVGSEMGVTPAGTSRSFGHAHDVQGQRLYRLKP